MTRMGGRLPPLAGPHSPASCPGAAAAARPDRAPSPLLGFLGPRPTSRPHVVMGHRSFVSVRCPFFDYLTLGSLVAFHRTSAQLCADPLPVWVADAPSRWAT